MKPFYLVFLAITMWCFGVVLMYTTKMPAPTIFTTAIFVLCTAIFMKVNERDNK